MMTEAAIDGGITRDLYAALVKSWKTARGPCVFTTNRLFADLGGWAADVIGRAAVPV